jgi:hypothetical protein
MLLVTECGLYPKGEGMAKNKNIPDFSNLHNGVNTSLIDGGQVINAILDDIERSSGVNKAVDKIGKPLPEKTGGDGMKSIDFSAWGGFEAFLQQTSTGAGGVSKPQMLRRVLPWMSKADSMTANAIASLPFDILDEGGKVIDTSEDWQDKLGGMPTPQLLIRNLASSLCLGKAYIIPLLATNNVIQELHYCAPHTVFPLISSRGLQYFSRGSDYGQSGVYYPAGREIESSGNWVGEMMYFWMPDRDVEIGPAKTFPAGTALLAAELLTGIDSVLNNYSDRGFVPATALFVKGMPNQADRSAIEQWWNRWLKNTLGQVVKIFNAESITAQKIGAGLDELKTVYADVVHQAIENIGASHGIPAAIFMSDAAFASEMNEMVKMWYSTSEFIAIYQCIEDTFNTQLLNRWNYHMSFRPHSLDIFQDDASKRAIAFRDFVSTRMRPSLAGELVGLKMPEGKKYTDLDEDFNKPAVDKPVAPLNDPSLPPSQVPVAAAPFGKALTAPMVKDLDLWRQIAMRCHTKGKGNAENFECKALPDELAQPIRASLTTAKTEDEINKAFEISGAPMAGRFDGLKELAAAINRASDIVDKKG